MFSWLTRSSSRGPRPARPAAGASPRPGASTAVRAGSAAPAAPEGGRPAGTERRRRSPWDDLLGRTALRSGQLLLVLLLVSVTVWGLRQVSLLVIPLLIATIIAAAVAPVVRWLRGRGVHSTLATSIAMVVGVGTLALVLWFVGRAVRNEWDELRTRAVEGFDELQRWLTEGPLQLDDGQITAAREQLGELASSDAVQSGAVAGATALAEVVTGTVLALVVLFFLLRDHRRIWEFFLRPLEPDVRRRADRIGVSAVDVLGGYVRGISIIALVDAFFIGLALFILGVPLALPLAVLVFLGAFIPILGATLAGTFAALVALVSDGPVTALIVIGVVVAVNQLEGNFLEPVVLGRALHLHPLAVLLALTAGTILSGIVGALLAVPLAAVAWTVVSAWNATDGGEEDHPGIEGSRDRQSRMVTTPRGDLRSSR
ncbi:membrane protein [Actinotalea ferrariae CF5-4]|uniref:Membrane protein n=1 Tax=Actinotalea ferrariae CF5-4 TaxID=948458 RepID=A0A021VMH7_9CELL|nr:AI-2E family transporter [Actinotalea ferrariae]EYR62298.1 membrane protein [Actinotalea ferrariae CF5-4]